MTRERFRVVAGILVAVLVAGVAWLLLAPRRAPEPGDAPEARPAAPRRESGEAAEAREAAEPGPGAPQGSGGGAPADPVTGDAAPAEEEVAWVRARCALEDGTPLAGVRLEIAAREVAVGDGEAARRFAFHESHRSDAGGAVAVRRTSTDLRVSHPHAVAVSVEGAALEPPASDRVAARVVLPPGEGDLHLRIVLRDRPGTAHVRLEDSATREPIDDLRGLRLSFLFGADLGSSIVYNFPEDTGLGGWIPIREGALPEDVDVRADPASVVVEFAAPGFAPARVALLQIRGRMHIGVQPVPPCATGFVTLPKGPGAPPVKAHQPVETTIRPQDGQPAQDLSGVRGLPTRVGPFRLDDLPQGAFVLEVTDTRYATIRRAKRAFEYRGVPVDLGEIRFEVGARIVARAVDPDGEPIPQARVVILREGEDPEKARALPTDEDGWVGLSDLEPAAAHRVVALGLPRPVEKRVHSSADGEQVAVEIPWPERLVPCRIALVVDGKAVANPDGSRTIPATVNESPLPRESGAWHPDGTFEARLVPGTYRFSVYATPEGGGELVLFAGEVTVPSGDAFETRLELRREGR